MTRSLTLAVLLSLVCLHSNADPAAPRPNILYLYVDDMGWGSIGPNGQTERRAKGLPSVRTPHLDELAARGVNFTRAYGATVCSPARSSQQTGFHQGHTFADRNDPDNAKKAIRADDRTMGDLLSEAGYVTGYWGKWGYGGTRERAAPEIVNIATLPTSHGYRHVLAELHHVRAHTFFQPTLWSAPARDGSRGGLELVPNSLSAWSDPEQFPDHFTKHREPDYPDPAYCDDAYCFAALEFVREQAVHYKEKGRPFFGLLAVQIPHAPFDEIATLPGWDAAYREDPHFASLAPQSQQWAAMVTRIDAHFGLILDALDDPNGDGDPADSVADDTLVIFMSDNGGPRGRNNEEFDANGGLRGNKGGILEGGIRVPTLMRWPARITPNTNLQAGTNCGEVIDVTDLLPTFCELAGVPAPVGLDGVSFAPLLLGEEVRRRRSFLIHEAGRYASIIRGRHKLIRSVKSELSLYDLEADPAEERDLAVDFPDLVAELEPLLLGERVTEPKGFANTYHHWTGANGGSANEATNWSDYIYENEGITYLTDSGAPRLSWIAHMRNTRTSRNRAEGDTDLSFLALEIGSESGVSAPQELALHPGVVLTGRNEIRLANGGILTLDQSTVSSLRWLEVGEGGILRGTGTIDATVYNKGVVSVAAGSDSGDGGIRMARGFRQGKSGQLDVVALPSADSSSSAPIQVRDEAVLNGRLTLSWKSGSAPQPGDRYSLIEASAITGRFAHPGDRVRFHGGVVRLCYHETGVDAVVESIGEEPTS